MAISISIAAGLRSGIGQVFYGFGVVADRYSAGRGLNTRRSTTRIFHTRLGQSPLHYFLGGTGSIF
ncbi:UNVERIFIED_CONTAM: hypothetical protein Sradi_3019200 [Sesamum radiatum]|uniref:Uncharacterized protein n=1 Tax=Sesamum radiatum TaxID=300843 RepID=A0AAW2S1F1_SESRA